MTFAFTLVLEILGSRKRVFAYIAFVSSLYIIFDLSLSTFVCVASRSFRIIILHCSVFILKRIPIYVKDYKRFHSFQNKNSYFFFLFFACSVPSWSINEVTNKTRCMERLLFDRYETMRSFRIINSFSL